MARYSPAPVPISDLDQTQRFLREEFEQVRNSTDDTYDVAEFLVENFVIAGYGKILRNTPVALNDINATWQTLPWEVSALDPRGIIYDLPNGMKLETTGVWNFSLIITLEFAEAQQGRELQFRFFNETDQVGSFPLKMFVGRNTAGYTAAWSYVHGIDIPGGTTDTVSMQVNSATGTFTGVTFTGGAWSIVHQSEYQGNFFNELNSIDKRRG